MTMPLEEAWQLLQRQYAFADGFWLGFVCGDDLRPIHTLRARVEELVRAQRATLLVVEATTPEALWDALRVPDGVAARAAAIVWVEAMLGGDDGAREWGAWLLRANERRERWMRAMQGGLLLVGPAALKRLAPESAPDLWTLRSLVLDPAALPPSRATGSSLLAFPALTEPVEVDAPVTPRVGTGPFAAGLDAVRALVAAGQPKEALHRWETLAHTFANAHTREALGSALADIARAELAADDVPAARDHLARAIALAGDVRAFDGAWFLNAALLAQHVHRWDDALHQATRGVAVGERLLAELPSHDARTRQLLRLLALQGNAHEERGEYAEMAAAYRRAVDLARRAVHPQDGHSDRARDLAMALNNLGMALTMTGHHAEALAAVDEAVGRARSLVAQSPDAFRPDLAMGLYNRAAILEALHRSDEARAAVDEAITLYRDLAKRDPARFAADLAVSEALRAAIDTPPAG